MNNSDALRADDRPAGRLRVNASDDAHASWPMVFPDRLPECENEGVVGIDQRIVHSAAAGVPAATAKSPAGPPGVVLTAPGLKAAPAPQQTEYTEPVTEAEVPWVTIVWNDPVNLMSYVTLVFQKLLGHPRPKAEALMLDVHHKGRATVSNGPREQMEADVAKLQGAGLWATMAKDS